MIKRQAGTLSKGFYSGCEAIEATRRFIVYPGKERFPVANGVTALSVVDVMQVLREMK